MRSPAGYREAYGATELSVAKDDGDGSGTAMVRQAEVVRTT